MVSTMQLTRRHHRRYPIDEGLLASLQAGGVASCRSPLFDFTAAHLQGQVRALIEERALSKDDSVLTLPVNRIPLLEWMVVLPRSDRINVFVYATTTTETASDHLPEMQAFLESIVFPSLDAVE